MLGGREPRFDLVLDGTRTYLSTEGVGVRVRDADTGEERPSSKADVELMARVVDALPAISFFWPPVSAQDHARTAPLHECHAGLTNTLKHVRGATTVHPLLAERIVEMATVVAGSEATRRARPPVCGNICTISPLSQDDTGLQAALVYAAAGIPVSFMAMPTMGSSAPASLAGAIAQGEAEVVSALVLIQLAFPGAPVFHSNLISAMDPRSGGYIGDIEAPAERLITRLGHAWGVPHLCGPSVSGDEARIGWGFGSRAGIGAALLSGTEAELSGDLGGLLDSYTVLEPHFVVLQHELVMAARRQLDGLPPTPILHSTSSRTSGRAATTWLTSTHAPMCVGFRCRSDTVGRATLLTRRRRGRSSRVWRANTTPRRCPATSSSNLSASSPTPSATPSDWRGDGDASLANAAASGRGSC